MHHETKTLKKLLRIRDEQWKNWNTKAREEWIKKWIHEAARITNQYTTEETTTILNEIQHATTK